ncbi:MAG TPA: potassium-transporting ATPase subunit C [Gemmataceae bacterium]|nr:potassium-transporting ATPase subunit C [Gemmataceae bacterium]
MSQYVRPTLWLTVVSLVFCSVCYPLVLWGIGQSVFPERANGSIVMDQKTGEAIGSRLAGQPFTKDEYFHPRPSAAGSGNGYNAATSGASNFGASNPLLRARVAQQLGPIVNYKGPSPTGNTVQKDIEQWFAQWSKNHPNVKDGVVAKWADTYPSVAAVWVKTDDPHKDYVKAWMKTHPEAVKEFVKAHPDNPQPQPEDLATDFFKSYAKTHPGSFASYAVPEGKTEKVWQDVKEGSDIHSFFFDMWLQEHPEVNLEQVPADMVMSSGSGLDPDITLKNALYQLDNRVAEAWARRIKGDLDKARDADKDRINREVEELKTHLKTEIEQMLNEHAAAPLGGLLGGKLVNVLEMNLALRDKYAPLAQPTR